MQKFGFIISVLTLLLSCACMVHAQAAPDDAGTFYAADSTYILYKTGVSTVDTTFNYNGESLGRFISSIHMTEANGSKVYVEINSGASPEGDAADNKLLSDRRTDALASYIIRHAGLSEKQIRKHSEGVAWKDLHKAVNYDNSTPYRNEVLRILQDTTGDRNKKLKSLHSGEAYGYMLANIFPRLRFSTLTLFSNREQHLPYPDETPAGRRTLLAADLGSSYYAALTEAKNLAAPIFTLPLAVKDNEWSHKLYIKTNAIGLGMLVLNAAVEYGFSDLFSFNLPVYYSGANYFSRRTKFRILGTQPELRIWPTENRRFFAGVHFGVASYNFAIKSGGYRIQDHNGNTPALGGGISVGYRMPFCRNKHFLLEFAIGAGAYRAYYDKFNNSGSGAYHSTVRETYIGIDNAAVSFTYMFNLNKRRK